MKRILFLLMAVLLVAGCKKNEKTAEVRVHVNDFTISMEDFPAKSDPVNPEDYAGVKAITLAFYDSDGVQKYSHTQLRADQTTYTTFGEFTCSLLMGSYTMVVLGHGLKDEEPAITLNSATEATFGDYPVRETFVATQTVNVNTTTNAIAVNAVMNRVIAKVHVISADNRPDNVETLKVTFSAGGKGVNPQTGLATSNTGFTNTLQPNTAVGTPTNIISYLFLDTDEQTMDLTIEALDYDGETVFEKDVTDVPLQRNKITRLTGMMYTSGTNSTFTINTDFITDTTFVGF